MNQFSDLLDLYFGLPYEPEYMRHGREIWLRRQTSSYRKVYRTSLLAVAKARTQRLFARALAAPSLLNKIPKDPAWSGGALVAPLGWGRNGGV